MKKIRILHVFDHSLPIHSGYTFRSAAIVREQRALGWETAQITTPKQGVSPQLIEDVEDLRFHRTPSPEGTGLLGQMRLTAGRIDNVVRELKPELIHAHSPVLNALPSLWVGRKRRLPVVYEMRASWEDAAVDHGTTTEGSLRYRASRALETFALRRADQVTTICDGLRGEILSRGVPASKVEVIPNAVDACAFRFGSTPDEGLRRTLGLEGKTVVGFAGSFFGYEGLHLLISALGRLAANVPELRLLLVGDGYQDQALRRQARAEGVADRVLFTGRVPHAEVGRYYDLIDILAYPRVPMRLTELVTPLKPLEAMAQGRILIASDVGGHRELIRDRQTGFLFPAGSVEALAAAIADVVRQRDAWPVIRQQAREYVERERTWANSVRRYRSVYARALQAFGRPTDPLGTESGARS